MFFILNFYSNHFNEHTLLAHILAIAFYCMYYITSASSCNLCNKDNYFYITCGYRFQYNSTFFATHFRATREHFFVIVVMAVELIHGPMVALTQELSTSIGKKDMAHLN